MNAPTVQVSRDRQASVATVLPFAPRTGAIWPRYGGRYVGKCSGFGLVMGEISCAELDWESANGWAQSLRVGVHKDFQLPNAVELRFMVRSLPTLFAVSRLWSADQVAEVPADAWVFDLLTDDVVGWGKHYTSFAVAVRRELTWRIS